MRPNYKFEWRICPLCTLDYRGVAEGPCPRCLAFGQVVPRPAVCRAVLIRWGVALAVVAAAFWWLVIL